MAWAKYKPLRNMMNLELALQKAITKLKDVTNLMSAVPPQTEIMQQSESDTVMNSRETSRSISTQSQED